MSKIKIWSIIYVVTIICLFFYSFTQVDLSLTMSRLSVWQTVQKSFQYIGYFNRPLSAFLYVLLLLVLFSAYVGLLKQKIKKISTVWKFVILTAVVLFASYNAFSYDLFNYIFDAKIVTHYGQDPYIHKALDFATDPMLSFMRWTHRVYPYGPAWLALTVPVSFLGLQYFLPTFFLFKLGIALTYVGSCFVIKKMQEIGQTKNQDTLLYFALSPLIVIESLVSAHNDIVMMFFCIASIFFLLKKKIIFSIILLLLSIGIKFATVFLLPVYLFVLYKYWKKQHVDPNMVFIASAVCMLVAVIASSVRTELQPWYFVWVLPFIALSASKPLRIVGVIVSFVLLLYYLPFLYTGNWDPPIPLIKTWLLVGMITTSIIVFITNFIKRL